MVWHRVRRTGRGGDPGFAHRQRPQRAAVRAGRQLPVEGADDLAERHTALAITEPVTPAMADFNVGINNAVRPYPVLNTRALIEATTKSISDPALRDMPVVGGIDQLTTPMTR